MSGFLSSGDLTAMKLERNLHFYSFNTDIHHSFFIEERKDFSSGDT